MAKSPGPNRRDLSPGRLQSPSFSCGVAIFHRRGCPCIRLLVLWACIRSILSQTLHDAKSAKDYKCALRVYAGILRNEAWNRVFEYIEIKQTDHYRSVCFGPSFWSIISIKGAI